MRRQGAYGRHRRHTRRVPAADVLVEGRCRVEHLRPSTDACDTKPQSSPIRAEPCQPSAHMQRPQHANAPRLEVPQRVISPQMRMRWQRAYGRHRRRPRRVPAADVLVEGRRRLEHLRPSTDACAMQAPEAARYEPNHASRAHTHAAAASHQRSKARGAANSDEPANAHASARSIRKTCSTHSPCSSCRCSG